MAPNKKYMIEIEIKQGIFWELVPFNDGKLWKLCSQFDNQNIIYLPHCFLLFLSLPSNNNDDAFKQLQIQSKINVIIKKITSTTCILEKLHDEG